MGEGRRAATRLLCGEGREVPAGTSGVSFGDSVLGEAR